MALTKFRVIGSTALVEATLSLLPDESQCTLNDLQPWDDGIQIHPVDAFDLQNHMLVQHVGNRLW